MSSSCSTANSSKGLQKGRKSRTLPAMLNLSNYDRVVSQIYEAALVPAQWDIALTSLINLFGPREWEVAMILWERLDPPAGRFIGAAGVHQLARDAYLGHFAGRQEWSRRGHDMRAGRVAHSDELIPREEFRETPFYRHYLEPWGFEVALIGNLDRHGKDHLGIICPGPPDLDPGDLQEAIVRLLPHFQRAARISRRIGEADMRAAAATDLLDNSPYCVMALGSRLELLLANGPAQAMMELGDGLALVNNRLKVNDPTAARQLEAMAAGKSAEHACTFSVTASSGHRLLLQAISCSATQSEQYAGAAAGASLMIIGGQRMDVSETAIAALRQGFDLTAAEARLAAFLIEGSGARLCAGTWRIAGGWALFVEKHLCKDRTVQPGRACSIAARSAARLGTVGIERAHCAQIAGSGQKTGPPISGSALPLSQCDNVTFPAQRKGSSCRLHPSAGWGIPRSILTPPAPRTARAALCWPMATFWSAGMISTMAARKTRRPGSTSLAGFSIRWAIR
jgi:hypothetical protein